MESYLINVLGVAAVFVIAALFVGALTPIKLLKPALIGVGVLATATILAKISLKYRDDLPPDDSEESQ